MTDLGTSCSASVTENEHFDEVTSHAFMIRGQELINDTSCAFVSCSTHWHCNVMQNFTEWTQLVYNFNGQCSICLGYSSKEAAAYVMVRSLQFTISIACTVSACNKWLAMAKVFLLSRHSMVTLPEVMSKIPFVELELSTYVHAY
jgi:hypothetical protein